VIQLRVKQIKIFAVAVFALVFSSKLTSVFAAESAYAATWTDPTISTASTRVKAVHISELRTEIDKLRISSFSLAGYGWTWATGEAATGQKVRYTHINELRAAVKAIFDTYNAIGSPSNCSTVIPTAASWGTITETATAATRIRVRHITDLRSAVDYLDNYKAISCYLDTDGDTYGTGAAITACNGCPGGYAPTAGDCCDAAGFASVKPGQTYQSSAHAACSGYGNWDYDCSGAVETNPATIAFAWGCDTAAAGDNCTIVTSYTVQTGDCGTTIRRFTNANMGAGTGCGVGSTNCVAAGGNTELSTVSVTCK
jgi:hypothetical protein